MGTKDYSKIHKVKDLCEECIHVRPCSCTDCEEAYCLYHDSHLHELSDTEILESKCFKTREKELPTSNNERKILWKSN